jgi:hypothetical protein
MAETDETPLIKNDGDGVAVNQEAVDAVVEDIAMQAAEAAAADDAAGGDGGDDDTAPNSSKKKRLCRYPGCTRVIKSQGEFVILFLALGPGSRSTDKIEISLRRRERALSTPWCKGQTM